MTIVQLCTLTEEELELLIYILNQKIPKKFPFVIDRSLLLSFKIEYIAHYMQQIANDVKEEYRPLLESLFFKVTHEPEHVIDFMTVATIQKT